MSSPSIPKTMQAACVVAQGKPLEIKQVPVPEAQEGEVLVKVHACGVCHSDQHVLDGDMGPPQIQRLGHEFIGTVVATPAAEKKWKLGDRVGGAWHGGHDMQCRACNRGLFQMCANKTVNGVFRDGGYAEYATLRSEAAVRVPADADPAAIAPLLCAGVSVFNAMRRMHKTAGDLVAVQGMGGLGHLAVQYARKMGFRAVVLSRGTAKRDFAMQLGATEYIDTQAGDVGAELMKMGGAAMMVVTAPNPEVVAPLLGGMAPGGTVLNLVPMGPVQVDTTQLVLGGLSFQGWPAGHALDCEEAIEFAQTHGVTCMVEKFPLAQANEAMEHMMSGKVRFRGVLTME